MAINVLFLNPGGAWIVPGDIALYKLALSPTLKSEDEKINLDYCESTEEAMRLMGVKGYNVAIVDFTMPDPVTNSEVPRVVEHLKWDGVRILGMEYYDRGVPGKGHRPEAKAKCDYYFDRMQLAPSVLVQKVLELAQQT